MLAAASFAIVKLRLRLFSCAASVSGAILCAAGPAAAEPVNFHIESGDLSSALMTFARKAHIQIVINHAQLRGMRAMALSGRYEPVDAVTRLVAGAPVAVEWIGRETVAIRAKPTLIMRTADVVRTAPLAAPPSPVTGPAGNIDFDIVVTARKREESLLDVPVVVAAFDKNSLESYATRSIEDVAQLIPSLTVQTSGGSNIVGQITLRGISTTPSSATAEQAVMISIDGVPLGSALALRGGQIDLQQVEVLKGPQALYFGKNASAGVIALRSADPSSDFFVQMRGAYEFNAAERTGEVIVSGPLTDTLGYRAVASYTGMAGWLKNQIQRPVRDRTRPDYNEFFGRMTLEWKPNETFNTRFKFSRTDHEGNGFATSQKLACASGIDPQYECRPDGNTIRSDPASGEKPFDNFDVTIGSLATNLKLSDSISLSSNSGYYVINQQFLDNINTTDTGFNINSNTTIRSRSISQELRASTEFSGPVNLTLGGFVEDVSIDLTGRLSLPRPQNRQHMSGRSYSIFGDASVEISPQLEVSGGGRYTYDKKTASGFNITSAGGIPAGVWMLKPNKISFNNFSPELTLTWRPMSRFSIFGSYKQGFKAGSFQIAPAANTNATLIPLDTSFNSESVEGGEIGIKGQFFDRNLTFTSAAYYYSYADIQLSTFDPQTSTTRIINAAAARVQGVEAQVSWRAPLAGLTLTGSVNYNRSRFRDFVTDCNPVQISTASCPLDINNDGRAELQNLAGQPLPNAPEWSGSAGFTLSRPISTGMRYQINGLATYSSNYQTDSRNDPRAVQSAFWVLNLSAGLIDEERGWKVDVIGRNLTNRYAILTSGSPSVGTGIPGDVVGNVTRGRQIMVQLTLTPTAIFAR